MKLFDARTFWIPSFTKEYHVWKFTCAFFPRGCLDNRKLNWITFTKILNMHNGPLHKAEWVWCSKNGQRCNHVIAAANHFKKGAILGPVAWNHFYFKLYWIHLFTDSFYKFYISKANCKLKAGYKNTNLSSFNNLSSCRLPTRGQNLWHCNKTLELKVKQGLNKDFGYPPLCAPFNMYFMMRNMPPI